MDTLLDTRAVAARREGEAAINVPLRLIPPHALVLALSPLLEGTVLDTLLALRGRGFDVAVVEVPPLTYLEIAGERPELTARFLRLERELLHSRLRARGIAVVEWSENGSLEATILAIEGFRRRARVVRA